MKIKMQVKAVIIMMLLVFTVSLRALEEEGNKEKERGAKSNVSQKDSTREDTKYYPLKKREEVSVTATITPKALKDISTSVCVLGRKDIELLPFSSGLSVLHATPGIFVNRSGDFGRADVDIRGLGQNCRRVAVLVDGKPEKMGLYGCAVSHAFPLDNVERIEVVKGPASVLYGGEAMGGAINIITRLPQKRWETDLTASYGSFNTQQLNLKHGGNQNRFKYYITYDRRKSDGHVENSDYSGSSLTGKLVFQLNTGTSITLQGKYFDGKKYEPGTIDNPLIDFWNDYQRGAVAVALVRKWQKEQVVARVYRNFGKHRFSDGWDSRDYTNGVQLRYTTRRFGNNELTVGGDLRFFGGESFNWPVGKWDKKEAALFVQDEYIVDTRWILTAGFRLHWDSEYGNEYCPHLGIVYQLSNDTLFRAVVNKGFRSPQLNELYMYPAANAELDPEVAWNYEIGVEQRFGNRVTLKGSVFYMKGSNLIQTVPNMSPPPMYIFANTGEFSFTGAEVELEAGIGRNLFGHVAYSVMDTGDLTKGRPGSKTDVSLRFVNRRLQAMVQGQYVADYYAGDYSTNRISSYFLLNSRVIVPVAKEIELVVDVNNLFDTEYEIYGEFPGMSAGLYRMPGRNIQVGVRVRK
jgi:outer membrane cobalamin receptor